MAIATGLHHNGVGDREEEEQEDLGERGDSEVGHNGEHACHTGQQRVRHVGTSPVHGHTIGGSKTESVCGDVLREVTGICPTSPPRNTTDLKE